MASLPNRVVGLLNAAQRYGRPRMETFLRYARVELQPPTMADVPAIREGAQRIVCAIRSGGWRQLTVREAWLNTLVGAEVFLWFYVGECIGKRHFVGYDV